MLKRILLIGFFSYMCTGANAQHSHSIRPVTLQMNDVKCLMLDFPAEIRYADLGSEDVFVEKIASHPNILKLKAEVPFFEKTNISVVTTDGAYHSYVVEYAENPSYIAVKMASVKDSVMESDIISETRMDVSDQETSHLIFPQKVDEISLGSEEIISEKAERIDNIVKVKSTLDNPDEFMQTSITVITSDGTIYPIIADYAHRPQSLSVSFGEAKNSAYFQGVTVNDESMKKMAEWIIAQGTKINSIGDEAHKMTFQLNSIYTDQDIIAFNLYMKNSSRIDYGIDFVKAYIKDKKISKKTAIQEDEIYPIYSYYCSEEKVVKGRKDYNIVLFFKKFTIPEKRILYFELFEANGGRHIRFSASNKAIIKAKVIGE